MITGLILVIGSILLGSMPILFVLFCDYKQAQSKLAYEKEQKNKNQEKR